MLFRLGCIPFLKLLFEDFAGFLREFPILDQIVDHLFRRMIAGQVDLLHMPVRKADTGAFAMVARFIENDRKLGGSLFFGKIGSAEIDVAAGIFREVPGTLVVRRRGADVAGEIGQIVVFDQRVQARRSVVGGKSAS